MGLESLVLSNLFKSFRGGVKDSPLYTESERKLCLWMIDELTKIADKDIAILNAELESVKQWRDWYSGKRAALPDDAKRNKQ